MKKKTFILTLMMLLCTFVFGQDQWHWQKPASGEYQSSMTLMAIKTLGVGTNFSTNAGIVFINNQYNNSYSLILYLI